MRILWIHVPLSFFLASVYGQEFYKRKFELPLFLEAMVCIAAIVLGYIFFVMFITGEGTKTVRLQTEIGLAKKIHDHLVPAVDFRSDHLELYGRCSPASEVGGDLMDVCHAPGKTGIYVADVTGHGVPAGVSMGMIKSAIRMKLGDAPPLGKLVSGLNDVLCQTQRPGTLATLAALEIGSGRATWALAGHLPILVVRAPGRAVERLPNGHPPLGVFEGRAYDHHEVAASPGDLFVLLTDGLTEVFDAADEEFGQDRIERIVAEHADRPLAEIYERVLAGARAFGPQTDDQTLLLARIR
jgi:sigma-B regulation protein RsbU (phosphoserine phosphatase)